MSRRCAEAVEVRRGDEAPAQFVWRGRLYLIRAVLGRWVESGGWWASAEARSLFAGEPAPDVGGAVGAGVDDGEREVWRVEAAAGKRAGTGVYDLCFDWSAATWTVARVLD